MNICVFGTARSGTTAMYALLQKIILDNFGKAEYYYEPFLWDHATFNGPYESVNHQFRNVDSISQEGICQHQGLPLFIEDPQPYTSNEYLAGIFKKDPHPHLIKFIRANGRIKLIHAMDPGCKIIVMLRNPLDVCNSLKDKFSFFGGEFHRDDYPRFWKELRAHFHLSEEKEPLSDLQKNLLYWKYMNTFILDSAGQIEPSPLLVTQEELERDPAGQVKKICTFLGIQHKKEYEDYARERKSAITREFSFSQADFDEVGIYLDEYFKLLNHHSIDHRFTRKDITEKYTIHNKQDLQTYPYYGLNPLILITELKSLKKDRDRLQLEADLLRKDMDHLFEHKTELKKTKIELDKNKNTLSEIKKNPVYRLFKFFFEGKK